MNWDDLLQASDSEEEEIDGERDVGDQIAEENTEEGRICL